MCPLLAILQHSVILALPETSTACSPKAFHHGRCWTATVLDASQGAQSLPFGRAGSSFEPAGFYSMNMPREGFSRLR